jgi:hypothetical protein
LPMSPTLRGLEKKKKMDASNFFWLLTLVLNVLQKWAGACFKLIQGAILQEKYRPQVGRYQAVKPPFPPSICFGSRTAPTGVASPGTQLRCKHCLHHPGVLCVFRCLQQSMGEQFC